MVNRFSGSNKPRQGGFPVTHRQDFEAHRTGGDFRHTADQIDMNPPIPALGSTTAQGSLELISNIIASSGSGFISVGSTTGASGIYNVGSIATPTLKDAIDAAMVDDRILTNGGTILILAGVYTTSATIEINPGIKIIGENGGTIISGQTSNQPIFRIKRTISSNDINGNSGSGDIPITLGSNIEKNLFQDLILVDNLGGSVNSGNCTLSTSSMIQVERGANFECQNVSFWGRLNDGSIVNRLKTRHAVETTSGSSNGTVVSINKCFFDGLSNPINFNTQLGNIDFLTVTNCKFRYYGPEAVSESSTLDCAIRASYCNLQINNNYAVAASNLSSIFLSVTTTGGSTSNINSIVSNNVGYLSNSGLIPKFIRNNLSSATVVNIKLANNVWAPTNVPNRWQIKVSGQKTSTSADADLFGRDCLTYLIQSNLNAEVLLEPGTYAISTVSTNTNLSLIGSSLNKSVIELALTSGILDNSNNYYLSFLKKIENIYFYKRSGSSDVSIYVTYDGQIATNKIGEPVSVLVKDCIFQDVTLGSQNSMTTNTTERYKYSFHVDNCTFTSLPGSGLVSLRVAPNYNTIIENCQFNSLSGYAISYGVALYTSPGSTNYYVNKMIIKNCFIDLDRSNSLFSSLPSPFALANGSARSYLIDIDDGAYGSDLSTDLLIDNLSVRIDSNTSQFLSNSFFDGLDVSRLINIRVDNCSIINSKIESPYHTYDNSGLKAIIGSYITWKKNININNCQFFGGSNALKVILPSGATYFPNNLFISDNIFEPTLSGDLATRTMLDIDVLYQASPNNNPKIKVKNNSFFIRKDNELYPVETSYTYKTYGNIQINAPGCDVDFESNQVRTTLREISGISNENLAGVYINTSKNNGVLINRFTCLNISNNSINLENTFNIGGAQPDSSNNIFAALWCESTIIKVINNFFNYQSQTTNGTGNKTDLCLECSDISGSGDYIISNNIFSRAARSGISSNYIDSYIYLTNTNVYGRITDNSFTNEDPSGNEDYRDLLLFGPSVTIQPVYERNKNQRRTVVYSGTGFDMSLNGFPIGNPPPESHSIFSSASLSMSDADDPTWVFNYDGTNLATYRLFAQLDQLIPEGAVFLGATCQVSTSSLLNTSLAILKIYNMTNDISTTSSSVNLASVTSGTISLSVTPNQYVSGKHKCLLILNVTADLSTSGTRQITINNISIQYRY